MKYNEVLIVEDNPYDADLSLRILKENSLIEKVSVVEDGEEALDFIFDQSEYPKSKLSPFLKVIFLDIKLPKVNGFEILREIKSNVSTKNIPIVVFTSSNQAIDISTAYNLGASSYVVKPVDYDDFAKTVKEMGYYWIGVNKIE
ncbi:MAG: response regulator [Stygiobacter sp.]|nr:MAG: response regulator [Stygiobacter sp.]